MFLLVEVIFLGEISFFVFLLKSLSGLDSFLLNIFKNVLSLKLYFFYDSSRKMSRYILTEWNTWKLWVITGSYLHGLGIRHFLQNNVPFLTTVVFLDHTFFTFWRWSLTFRQTYQLLLTTLYWRTFTRLHSVLLLEQFYCLSFNFFIRFAFYWVYPLVSRWILFLILIFVTHYLLLQQIFLRVC